MKLTFTICLFLLVVTPAFGQPHFYQQLADSAVTLTKQNVQYDPGYFQIDYPKGDIPVGKGVCTDVVIRTYRKFGIDLQKKFSKIVCSNLK